MVARKNLMKKHVLISVFNKSNLKYLCSNLKKFKYDFISTGSTCKKIRELGFRCKEISEVTKFKEIMDGRVKTLNPKIYGSILFSRDKKNHLDDFKNLKSPQIDIVVINLYPFSKIQNIKENEKIEMIDIGGPSIIRAASKNFKFVTAISEIRDYKNLIENLKKNKGETDLAFRRKMASKTFNVTSKYDHIIYNWFNNKKRLNKKTRLRYGENPHQKAHIIKSNKKTIFDFQINGKEISYNNIIDVDSGFACLAEFNEPTCVIVKHTNPCGVASSNNIQTAFTKALKSDSKSAFGGIVLINRKVDLKLAKIIKNYFFEIIVSAEFTEEALNLLKVKKNLILLEFNQTIKKRIEHKSTIFGDIYQEKDINEINKNFIKLASFKKANKKNIDDLIFSLKVARHLKSNCIVLAKNKQTIGLGMGQTNRVDALNFALKRMKQNFNLNSFVCASDGFFPFIDSMKLLKKNKCKIIAQPSGSINDKKIIDYAVENSLSLYFTKNRLFKH